MDNLTQLMRIAGLITTPVPDQTPYTVLDGFLVDVSTGVIKGPYLHIEEVNYTNQPLFIYNRSVRFEDLVWKSQVPGPFIKDVLLTFCLIETVWEAHKEEFNRKYFLTQRLLCQEICKMLGCACSIRGRPIRDKRRYKKQLAILHSLLAFFLKEQKLRCQLPSPLESRLSSIILNLRQRFPSPAV